MDISAVNLLLENAKDILLEKHSGVVNMGLNMGVRRAAALSHSLDPRVADALLNTSQKIEGDIRDMQSTIDAVIEKTRRLSVGLDVIMGRGFSRMTVDNLQSAAGGYSAFPMVQDALRTAAKTYKGKGEGNHGRKIGRQVVGRSPALAV